MRNTITFILLLSGLLINAQENRKTIKGIISLDSLTISNVHIVNKTTAIGTNSNDNGNFEIPVQAGDTLFFSHINYSFKEFIIRKEDIDKKLIRIIATEKTYALEEFTLDNRSIFHVDKDIMPHNLPVVNAKTLNLPYAGIKKEKDHSVVKFRSGFAFNFEGLINRINGNHKRMIQTKKLVAEDENIAKIRKALTDDFFVTDLNIKKKYINQFLNFCKDKKIINVFKKGDQLELVRILIAESKNFPHQIENEDIFLTKN